MLAGEAEEKASSRQEGRQTSPCGGWSCQPQTRGSAALQDGAGDRLPPSEALTVAQNGTWETLRQQ